MYNLSTIGIWLAMSMANPAKLISQRQVFVSFFENAQNINKIARST